MRNHPIPNSDHQPLGIDPLDRGWIAWIADRQALPQISRQLTWRELRVNLTQGRSQRGYGIQ